MLRRTVVDFGRPIRPWDGFGVNYVQVAQTRDYRSDPQEYGGFSLLAEADREAILDMIYGPDGLRPALVKMFLDPFHQPEPGPGYDWSPDALDPTAYDHETTTRWMRRFVGGGLERTRARGEDLAAIVTLYGPPAWATVQRFVRGRDLDPARKHEVAKYMIAWARWLREVEGVPVKYISFHNEGEDWRRWPEDGSTADAPRHDYNLYWPPEQVVDFLRFMRPMLEDQGLGDVGLAPGETSNWYRFAEWGYADAIARDPVALANLGLITSHGFYRGAPGRWFGDWRSAGIDALRAARPELHAWVTSTSWGQMDVFFLNELRNLIYSAKVNGIIPWACIQRPAKWVGGDPNPGTAFNVHEDGTYTVEPGYHFYRQVCPVGRPGMSVAQVLSNDSEIGLIGFASGGTGHPAAAVVLNLADEVIEMDLRLVGSVHGAFAAYRSGPEERCVDLGAFAPDHDTLHYAAPPRTATTFVGA